MVKKSDLTKVPKPEPEKGLTPAPEQQQPDVKVTVHPKFTLTTPAPDLSPVVKAVKEMTAKQEPVVIQVEKDRKPKGFKVTITKRDYRGLIEEFECKEITDG